MAQSDPRLLSPVLPVTRPEPQGFQWTSALNESMRALAIEHGFRLAAQPATRKRLGGPFWSDYAKSVRSVGGWGDGDHFLINYMLHPIQGATTGYIQVQNDPRYRLVEFGPTREYWRSRLKALAWNAAYSTQFEIGPLSESSIGNVGMRKGTSGWVDFVVTPAGGFSLMIAEDALDKHVIQKLEDRTTSVGRRVFYRIALNPSRSLANILHGKWPWYREQRGVVPGP